MLSEQQARAVAFLLHEIRPDWPVASVMGLLEKHQDTDLGPLLIAATTKALEPSCRTPAPIFIDGAHWRTAPTSLERPKPCPTHTSYPAHNCGGCRADRLAQKDTP